MNERTIYLAESHISPQQAKRYFPELPNLRMLKDPSQLAVRAQIVEILLREPVDGVKHNVVLTADSIEETLIISSRRQYAKQLIGVMQAEPSFQYQGPEQDPTTKHDYEHVFKRSTPLNPVYPPLWVDLLPEK